MSDPRSITADALEILVARELRRAGIEPIGLRRHGGRADASGFAFDLVGRLQAYEHRWTAVIACTNRAAPQAASDIMQARTRADDAGVASVLVCTTAAIEPAALVRAREMAIAVLRVVDAQQALLQAGMIQPGQLPAWVPEFTLEIVTARSTRQLLESDQPELVLRELRASE